jgi:hypothetical protein
MFTATFALPREWRGYVAALPVKLRVSDFEQTCAILSCLVDSITAQITGPTTVTESVVLSPILREIHGGVTFPIRRLLRSHK